MNNKIRILIAEDSKVITELLHAILSAEPDFDIVACVGNGQEAVEQTKKLKPDLITMDIKMPVMDGLEATRIIMSEFPTPIVVISGHANKNEVNTTFDALNAGALTLIEKPKDILSAGFETDKRILLNTLRALSSVHVIRRKKIQAKPAIEKFVYPRPTNTARIAALGLSTGGPEVLNYILSNLNATISAPMVVVQHITNGFLPGLVSWLSSKSTLPLHIAENKQLLQKGHVYFAPNDRHLTIKQGLSGPVAVLEDSDAFAGFKPSVTKLFLSIAETYPNKAIAGLLTGMGCDGADGLLAIKKAGSYTFIQDKESSIVFGMPGSAQLLQAECDTIQLNAIPTFLNNTLKKGENNEEENTGSR